MERDSRSVVAGFPACRSPVGVEAALGAWARPKRARNQWRYRLARVEAITRSRSCVPHEGDLGLPNRRKPEAHHAFSFFLVIADDDDDDSPSTCTVEGAPTCPCDSGQGSVQLR